MSPFKVEFMLNALFSAQETLCNEATKRIVSSLHNGIVKKDYYGTRTDGIVIISL